MNRRAFLKKSSVIPIAAAGLTGLGSLNRLLGQEAAKTTVAAPAKAAGIDPDLKVGLNAYSFAKELGINMRGGGGSGGGAGGKKSSKKAEQTGGAKGAGTVGGNGMSLFGLIDYAADSAHRFDAVDLTGYYFSGYNKDTASVPTDEYIKKLRQHASDREMFVTGTGIGNTLTGVDFDREGRESGSYSHDEGGDLKKLANEVARIKAWIVVAAKLGAPVLRIFSGLEPSYLMKAHIKLDDPEKEAKAEKLTKWRGETFKRMVDAIQQFLPDAKREGVVVGIQNHGDFLQSAAQCTEVLDAVGDNKNFGLILDTGYFQTPDPYVDMERMIARAVNFQIKEFARVCPSDYVDPNACFKPMDLKRLMQIVRRCGYKGFLPIETLSAGKVVPYDPYREIPPFLQKVRDAIAVTAPGAAPA